VRYVTVKGGSSAAHARAFVAASGATPLELDDAIEETSGRGLVREHGQKLDPTPRGQAWLLAIRDQAHERATRLWLGEARANPGRKQGSFDWADDPKQLRLPDLPRTREPEISTPSDPPEPKPAGFRRPGARFRKGRAVIVFDPGGQLGPNALRAWAERFARSALGGVEPPFDYSGSGIPESRELFMPVPRWCRAPGTNDSGIPESRELFIVEASAPTSEEYAAAEAAHYAAQGVA